MVVESKAPLRFSSRAKFVTVSVVVILTLYLINRVSHIMLPFVLAIITAYIFNPVVTWLQRRTNSPRFVWVVLLYIIGFTLIFVLISNVVPLLSRQYTELTEALPVWVNDAEAYFAQRESIGIGRFQIEVGQLEKSFFDGIKEQIKGLPTFGVGFLTFGVGFLFGVIESLILTLVFMIVTFYLLVQAEGIGASFYKLIPGQHREEIRQLVGSIDRVLGAYIRGQFMLIAIMAVLSYIALTILGIKYALVIAIATGILEIIPFVGPYMAGGIAATVALLQGTTPFGWEPWLLAVVICIVYFILRMIEDHFIIPNLVGHMVNLHPILVIFAILAGGSLGGALGLLVAVPIAAAIKIVLVYLYSKLVDAPSPSAEVKAEERDLLDGKSEPGLLESSDSSHISNTEPGPA